MWVNQVDGALSPEGVQAIVSVATLAIAAVAAVIALLQVKQSRDLREEQARPYVVVFVERAGVSTVDLVVKNFGLTAARRIRLLWDREPLHYWSEGAEPMKYFDEIPVLVPGQEWRTVWDHRGRRLEVVEPPYLVTVRAEDSRQRALHEESFEISTLHFADEMRLDLKGLHEIGAAIEKIERTTHRWSEGVHGLSVFSRDGHARDEEAKARWTNAAKEPANEASAD